MAPFYASIWALIEEKGIKGVITTRKKAREFFLKSIVAVDGLNQGHNGGRAPVTFASFRNRVRATTFPRGILPLGAGGTARSAKDAYRWASGQFGGGLLPSIDSDRGKKILKRFVEIRALSKKGQL